MSKLSPKLMLKKIIQANLIGRSGSNYPTGIKWQRMYTKHHPEIYVVVNGSEGEPATAKDGFILKNYLSGLLDGVRYAYKIFPQTRKIYIYLRKDYYAKYRASIEDHPEIKGLPIVVFKKPGGYLCGENTVLLNAIEGKRLEPRRKPPYCSQVGIKAKPTLVNNLETFFRVGEIINGCYKETRFYTISGEVENPGVFDLPLKLTVAELLKATKNRLSENYFVQVGGGAIGLYHPYYEAYRVLANNGTGSCIVYDSRKTSFKALIYEKLNFLINQNCGKCTPCREGIFRMRQMVKENKVSCFWLRQIASVLSQSSFCGLGTGAGLSLVSLIDSKQAIWPKE